MKVLLSLIGGQPAPVYVGCLKAEPDLNVFITSNDTYKQAERLKTALSHYNTEFVKVDPFDFQNCYETIKKITNNYSSSEIILNLTSGTKIMSLAAYTIFKELRFPMIYIDSQNGRILSFDAAGAITSEEDSVKLSISNYFSIYGHSLSFEKNTGSLSVSEKKSATVFMNKYYVHVKSIIAELNKEIKDKNKTFYELTDPRTGAELRYNRKKIKGKMTVNLGRTRPELIISSEEMFSHITGGWFEDYVADELRNCGAFDEVKTNAKLFVDLDGQTEFRNEFDVLAMKNHTIYIFECKTGNLDKTVVDKLRLIRAISGTYSRIFLVTLFMPTAKNYLERIKDFNITLITKDKLREFVDSFKAPEETNPNP